jgi:peptide/nickel transport system substrate-binding protein
VVAYPSGPASIAPHQVNEEFAVSVLSNVYETLVELDTDLGLKPGLAESWYTPDPLTWAFRVRAGVKRHDGKVLEARDVAESLERTRADPSSRRQTELAPVASVEATDASTVVFHLRRPFGVLPNRLTNVFVSALSSRGEHVGTGRYRVRSWRPEGDTVLEAFADHRDGAPAVRVLEFQVVPSMSERLARLRAGRVHVVTDVSPADVARLAADGKGRALEAKGHHVVYLAMDCARLTTPHVDQVTNPFRDVRLREALAHAIDRAALVSGPLQGQGELLDQLSVHEVFGYAPSIPPRAFDPERSRRLLAEAGFRGGFTVDLDYMPERLLAIEALLPAIVADLARVGIQAVPRPTPYAGFRDRLRSRDTSLYLMGLLGNTGDAGWPYEYALHTEGGGYGVLNAGGYSNPELDQALEQAATLTVPATRARLLGRVAELAYAEVPIVPLYRQKDVYAVAPNVELAPRPDRRLLGAAVHFRP